MLEEKTHTITCRLDEADFEKLTSEAAALDINTSDYIRLLTRLPVEVKAGGDPDSYIIIEPKAVSILDYLIRKNGLLLNQAIHSLNTIALKINHEKQIDAEMAEQIKKALKDVEAVDAKLADIKLDTEALVEKKMLFLDRYRQKPKRHRKRQSLSVASTTES
ncbi:hypothetical protein [Adlercreutzia agrestimuris]|uniref:hypothetical protein n=1 Tax=Adlercreutzia agrestimuris TaxID=2941324 RepID=UPI002040B560|nr:hypothetical protein [Adlercreutzia agrestimuris]